MEVEGYLRSGEIRVSLPVIRQVWAELTRTPQASYREIGQRIGRHYSHVRYAVAMLVLAGYVESAYNRERARRVIVPFCVIEGASHE